MLPTIAVDVIGAMQNGGGGGGAGGGLPAHGLCCSVVSVEILNVGPVDGGGCLYDLGPYVGCAGAMFLSVSHSTGQFQTEKRTLTGIMSITMSRVR